MLKLTLSAAFTIWVLLPLQAFSQEVQVPGTTEMKIPAGADFEAASMAFYIDGINAFENEDFSRALELFSHAFSLQPESAGISDAMAETYLEMNNLSNAIYYAERAVEQDPENKWYHLSLARLYLRTGRPNAALDVYRKLVEMYPTDYQLLMQLANHYTGLGRFVESNTVYDRILALKGPSTEIHLQKFHNYLQAGMPDSAATELSELKEKEPDNISILHSLSQLYIEMGDVEAASETLIEARELDSSNTETLILQADLFIKQEQWGNLGNTVVAVLSDPTVPDDKKLELSQYIYLQHQSSPRIEKLEYQTRRILETLSDMEPEMGSAHLLAAEFYLNKNMRSAAMEKLEEAGRIMPEEAEIWRQRLQLMFSGSQYNNVIEVGEEATGYVADDAFIQFFVGASYMLTGRAEIAVEWLNKATIAPSKSTFRSVIHSTLGDAFMELDNWGSAAGAYETAIRLDNTNHSAMNNFAWYLTLRKERLDVAEELVLRALELEPENASYLDTAGWIYYMKEDYESARVYIEKAVDSGEANAVVLEHMGDVYDKLGMPDDAMRWWQRAWEVSPEPESMLKKLNR